MYPIGPLAILRIEPNRFGDGVWVVLSNFQGFKLRLGCKIRIQGTGVSDINGVNIEVIALERGRTETRFLHTAVHDKHSTPIHDKGRIFITAGPSE